MVNSQHFGIGDSTKNIIVPYVYNDVPNAKSQFTNPLLTLSLTIISHIVKTPEITQDRKNIMMKIIIDLYDKGDVSSDDSKDDTKKEGIGKIQKIRQEIELLRVDTIYELTTKYIKDGKSVAIFVNFTKSF